ncbi:hypothetical protein CR513_46980, partial [Mucuna pruriens]
MKNGYVVCYDIESKIFNSRQGPLSGIKYYGTLNELWIKLDQYQGLKICKDYFIAYTRLVERGRIFKFLHGLNSKYDPIWVQILGKEKLPYLFEVQILGKEKLPSLFEENIVEHPSISQLEEDIQAFSKEEIDRLRAILNSTSKSHDSYALTMKVSKKQLITIANGDRVLVVGFGNVQLHSSLSLHNELTTGRTIGVVKEQSGLYYLQHTKIDNGGIHELRCMSTPQQNGVAKRKNRHLLEVAKAFLF